MMGTKNARPGNLGDCPNCNVPLVQSNLQIEFETTHGDAEYAECPNCKQVISPD